MQMKAAIADMSAFRAVAASLPARARTLKAAEAIEYPATDLKFPTPDDLDVVAARIIEAFGAGDLPSRSDMHHAAWCVWGSRSPLSSNETAFGRYLDHVRASGRKSAFSRLASAYVIAFPFGHVSLEKVAEVLRYLSSRYPGSWSAADRDLGLFDPDVAPRRLAQRALERSCSPAQVLRQFKIDGLSSDGGLSEAAFLAGLAQLRDDPTINPLDRLERVRTWGLRQDGRLIFEQHRGKLADVLVLPHADRVPDLEVRERYLSFLLKHFSDPRLFPGRWEPMTSTQVVRRWLTEQSLRQFLDVVDKVALDHQWRFRRAFWEAVFSKGLISDAWVVFDEDGVYQARRMFGKETPFAQWSTRPTQKGHACLLLRIGRGIVAEWSHNGQCHIWHNEHDQTAPTLHAPYYEPADARVASQQTGEGKRVSVRHMSPQTYAWQNKVSDEIKALTGVRLFQSDYRV